MISDLPKSCQVKNTIRNIDSEVTITDAPNGIIGVQLSLVTCLKACLKNLVPSTKETSRKVRIKLSGDGTLIARGLSVVVFAFTVLEED